ncbi:MAG: DUF1292 domain-containing protein [Peptoniphilaceae bacterium]|nr:DUF1292 domain-containing protein [Peptoniphilaceae bacterium]MDY6085603.1 DUF1292 domain-containing protein [Peptoniphilaceae bacterium]
MNNERIYLNDGTEDVALDLIASFGIDEANYCLVRDDDAEFFLRYEEKGEEVLFFPLESDGEQAEVMRIYDELLSDREEQGKRGCD